MSGVGVPFPASPSSSTPRLPLTYLDMSDCVRLDDLSLRLVVESCPQLQFLFLRRCSLITGTGGIVFFYRVSHIIVHIFSFYRVSYSIEHIFVLYMMSHIIVYSLIFYRVSHIIVHILVFYRVSHIIVHILVLKIWICGS